MHGRITDINMDYVMVCGQRVKRPVGVGRAEWLEFWEAVDDWVEE